MRSSSSEPTRDDGGKVSSSSTVSILMGWFGSLLVAVAAGAVVAVAELADKGSGELMDMDLSDFTGACFCDVEEFFRF